MPFVVNLTNTNLIYYKMKKLLLGLLLTMFVASICGCSGEEFVKETSQVTYAEMRVDFFKKSVTAMSGSTRASEQENANLKKSFKRLDIAFFPLQKNSKLTKDTVYTLSQNATAQDFGSVSIKLPIGKYAMVAIASKADKAVIIDNNKLVSFPDDKITDMAYSYEEVDLGKDGATINGKMARAVAKFLLKSTDVKGTEFATFKISFKGKCNTVFDPQLGYAVSNDGFTYSRSYDISQLNSGRIDFGAYVLPVTDNEKFTVNISLSNKDGEELKTFQFNDVPLKPNYVTTYTGKVFSTTAEGTFGLSSGDFESLGSETLFNQ